MSLKLIANTNVSPIMAADIRVETGLNGWLMSLESNRPMYRRKVTVLTPCHADHAADCGI